eukprot:CFRG7880T1
MFVDTVSANCQWERPQSMLSKGTADQWWQLKDAKTGRLYYFQSSTNISTWRRPSNEALIIPLENVQKAIQTSSGYCSGSADESSASQLSVTEIDLGEPPTYDEKESLKVKAKSRMRMIVRSKEKRKEIATITSSDTPANNDTHDREEIVAQVAHMPSQIQCTFAEDAPGATSENKGNCRSDRKDSVSGINDRGVDMENEDEGIDSNAGLYNGSIAKPIPAPRPAVVIKPRTFGSHTVDHPNHKPSHSHSLRQSISYDPYPSHTKNASHKLKSKYVQRSNTLTRTKSHKRQTRGQLSLHTEDNDKVLVEEQRMESRRRDTEDTMENLSGAGGVTLPNRKKSSSEENLTHLMNYSRRKSKDSIRPRAMSVRVNQLIRDPTDEHVKPLEEYANFFQDKISLQTRGIFKKKQSLEVSMAWTKDDIQRPMTVGHQREQKRTAIEMFKIIQTYMGDRTPQKYLPERDEMNEVARLASIAYERKGLRDELFVQICKQMTNNPSEDSVLRGFEMLVMLLHVFPPSPLFENYIESFLHHHTQPSAADNYLTQEKAEKAMVMADFCLKKLRRMEETGIKGGVPPNVQSLTYARRAAFRPTYFATTLQNIMLAQSSKFPNLRLPWLMPVLCDALIHREGLLTEGIFRVSGDTQHVGRLKCMVDEHHYDESVSDPHTPASLLKMWFRELLEPLIPDQFYNECLDASGDPAKCIDIVDELPDENRHVLKYIINFLQRFTADTVIKKTRMSVDNIAMVWAPNILRCPSIDPMIILRQSKSERLFVASLISNLDARDYSNLR